MAQAESNSKSYTDTEIEKIEETINISVGNSIGKFVLASNSENIFEFKDSFGNVVLALNKKGNLFLMMKILNVQFCSRIRKI